MRDRLSFAGCFCLCHAAVIFIICQILLSGCADSTKVADDSSKMVHISVESSVVQEATAEPSLPPVGSPPQTSSQQANRGQAITFETTVHDFGEVGPRSKNTCEFRFKNTGTGTLTVGGKIDSTCGCTATKLDKTAYAPGKEGTIKVTYTASTLATTARKYLTVHSNDRNNPQTKLLIKAKIVPRVAYEPKRLDIELEGKTTTCPAIKLRSLDGKPFSVTGILCTGNSLRADFDPSASAKEFTIQPKPNVEVLERVPGGYLLLKLSHPECKQVKIRYQARSEFQFYPDSVMVYGARPDAPTWKYVFLANNHGKDFEIESFSSEHGLVEVLEETKVSNNVKPGSRYRLKLSIKAPEGADERRIFADTLSIRLADGHMLKLDCRGMYSTPQAGSPYPPP